jgi:hypothetical protein
MAKGRIAVLYGTKILEDQLPNVHDCCPLS